jgi:hypothetical protein
MTNDWYGDGWEDDQWDSSGWADESQGLRRGSGRGWIVGAVILVAGVAMGIFFINRMNNTPQRAAQAWLQAVTGFDQQKAASLSCANVASSQQSGGQIGSEVLTMLQDSGNSLQEWGIPLDLSIIAEYIDFDIRDLRFETVHEEEDFALVHVNGPLSIRFQVLSLPLQLDEEWQMVREDGRWKWCGR